MNSFAERSASRDNLKIVHAHIYRVTADLDAIDLLHECVGPYVPEFDLPVPASRVYHVDSKWAEFSDKYFVLVHGVLVLIKTVDDLVGIGIEHLE